MPERTMNNQKDDDLELEDLQHLDDEDALEDLEDDEATKRVDDDEACGRWWAQLPDFIKPDYPFDMPPARLPFVQFVFTQMGAPRHCPEARCRRSGQCRGGDGPPCFRADRKDLQQVLFLVYMMLFADWPEQELWRTLKAQGNRYATEPLELPEEVADPSPS
jgi:hypothetical protein